MKVDEIRQMHYPFRPLWHWNILDAINSGTSLYSESCLNLGASVVCLFACLFVCLFVFRFLVRI